MTGGDHLFVSRWLDDFLDNRKSSVARDIESKTKEQLLDSDKIASELLDKYKLDAPALHKDQIHTTNEQAQVDVSQDPKRLILDRSRPFYLPGLKISVHIPFHGNPELFGCRPSTHTLGPPVGKIVGNEVVVEATYTDGDADGETIRHAVDRNLAEIEQWLSWIGKQVDDFNGSLPEIIRTEIQKRRDRFDRDDSVMSSLSFLGK